MSPAAHYLEMIMNCYETLFSLTAVALAPYALEAVSPWIRRAVKRVTRARAPI